MSRARSRRHGLILLGTSSHRTKTASRQTIPRRHPQNRTVQAISGATHRADNEHGTAGFGMRLAFGNGYRLPMPAKPELPFQSDRELVDRIFQHIAWSSY
jgi:hypothetical protein